MKGVLLAGGKGTRMVLLTAVTNKHLIPVGDIPMIEYPLYTLEGIGVQSVSVVTGGEHFNSVSRYLEEVHGETRFSYHNQREAGGIAQALGITEPFVRDDSVAVILGDNIFEDNFYEPAKEFEKSNAGAMLFLKETAHPERFGIAEIKDGKIISIEEKPKNPKSNLAVTGLYLYDNTVFDKIKTLKPSGRGEYEISDINNLYIQEGRLRYHLLKGFWSDAGTLESRRKCEDFVRKGLEQKIIASLPEETRKKFQN